MGLEREARDVFVCVCVSVFEFAFLSVCVLSSQGVVRIALG